MAEAKGVEAVDRALKLLDCFEISDQSLTLAELSRRSGYYKSTILRIAESLDRGGYMLRQEDGQFRLGPTLWRLGSMYRQNFHLAEHIRKDILFPSGKWPEEWNSFAGKHGYGNFRDLAQNFRERFQEPLRGLPR